ncbi:MAG: ROK family protein [Actinomycetia bacterium]|nr:ROK family protein [Actinomycetes bacterium]
MNVEPLVSLERSPGSETESRGDKQCLAIDIGGTKLAVGVVSERGQLLDRLSIPTVNQPLGDEQGQLAAEDLFESLMTLVRHYRPFDQYLACGVGSGGPMTAGGVLISPLNIPAWRSFPLANRLQAETKLATFVDNDAKALALGEGWVGAAKGKRNYLAMVVSTGVGGGIVLDGRLLDGQSGNAGHVGHMVVPVPGLQLPNHVRGVLEAEASGTAIAHHTGRPPAEASHQQKIEVGTLVGRATGSVANLLDLPLIVVAGSVALGFGEVFFRAAQAEIDRICQLDFSRETIIVAAGCGDAGPLIGAGAVGFRNLGFQLGAISPLEIVEETFSEGSGGAIPAR